MMAILFRTGLLQRIELIGTVWLALSALLLKILPVLGAHLT